MLIHRLVIVYQRGPIPGNLTPDEVNFKITVRENGGKEACWQRRFETDEFKSLLDIMASEIIHELGTRLSINEAIAEAEGDLT